jgi:hypothetical protein
MEFMKMFVHSLSYGFTPGDKINFFVFGALALAVQMLTAVTVG